VNKRACSIISPKKSVIHGNSVVVTYSIIKILQGRSLWNESKESLSCQPQASGTKAFQRNKSEFVTLDDQKKAAIR
jgi:hypothetical protein